jgi:hypothetical protein
VPNKAFAAERKKPLLLKWGDKGGQGDAHEIRDKGTPMKIGVSIPKKMCYEGLCQDNRE